MSFAEGSWGKVELCHPSVARFPVAPRPSAGQPPAYPPGLKRSELFTSVHLEGVRIAVLAALVPSAKLAPIIGEGAALVPTFGVFFHLHAGTLTGTTDKTGQSPPMEHSRWAATNVAEQVCIIDLPALYAVSPVPHRLSLSTQGKPKPDRRGCEGTACAWAGRRGQREDVGDHHTDLSRSDRITSGDLRPDAGGPVEPGSGQIRIETRNRRLLGPLCALRFEVARPSQMRGPCLDFDLRPCGARFAACGRTGASGRFPLVTATTG